MTISKLKVASISDVHLGHRNTPTAHIVRNLLAAFPDTEETGELDIIFIAGDLFDTVLPLPSEPVLEIIPWIFKFLVVCKKRNIKVRVLEGTPSHDWKQSKIMELINDGINPLPGMSSEPIGADLEYLDTLCIRYMEEEQIHVLYVPDEWDEPDRTWSQVQTLLLEHGIDKVDISVMHGAFQYQLPPQVQAPTHTPERYLSITKYNVYIGHIHQFSIYDRIIAQGSFDRLSHGDETAKGHVRSVIQNGKSSTVFIENTNAMMYLTVDCRGLILDKALARIAKAVKPLPNGSHVRIFASPTDVILASTGELGQKYPQYKWSSKDDKSGRIKTQKLLESRTTFKSVEINKGNIAGITEDRLKVKGVAPEVITRCMEMLGEVT